MTEEEWLTSNDVVAMLLVAEGCSSSRTLRLFMLDCAQRVCHLLGPRTRRHLTREMLVQAYEVLEGGPASANLDAVVGFARVHAGHTATTYDTALEARGKSRHTLRVPGRDAVASNLVHAALTYDPWWRTSWDVDDELEARRSVAVESLREQTCRDNLPALRCIVGNPFRPVAFDPRWRTEHAVGLAARMYDERNFDAMPILADALEEAGCDNRAVLDHCREPGLHARGCWVVDGVLGKR